MNDKEAQVVLLNMMKRAFEFEVREMPKIHSTGDGGVRLLAGDMYQHQGGREELFFSFPNEEAFLPFFIDEDHLRGIFHVFD